MSTAVPSTIAQQMAINTFPITVLGEYPSRPLFVYGRHYRRSHHILGIDSFKPPLLTHRLEIHPPIAILCPFRPCLHLEYPRRHRGCLQRDDPVHSWEILTFHPLCLSLTPSDPVKLSLHPSLILSHPTQPYLSRHAQICPYSLPFVLHVPPPAVLASDALLRFVKEQHAAAVPPPSQSNLFDDVLPFV
jgi:hypothetical protein